MSAKFTHKDVVAEVKKICEKTGLIPQELTKSRFLSETELEITGRQLDRLGGFQSIVSDHFGPTDDKDLAFMYGSSKKRAYISKLEKIVGEQDYLSKNLAKVLCTELKGFSFPTPATIKKPSVYKEDREIVAFISDTHFGISIESSEIGSANAYSWTIAARRMALFATQIATFKEESRSDTPTLRLCLGGDLAQGIIHLDDANTDLITNQVIGTTHIIYQLITYLRQFFKTIKVECTPDNHLRMVHKSPGRATNQKYDSYATMIHHALAMGFKHCEDVTFNIPRTPYTIFNVLGNNFYLTHGDTLINVGHPGKRINTEAVGNAANKLNAGLKDSEEYKVIMVGHVHTPTFITLDNGTELVVNGTGSGLDPYAQSIGIFESNPVQVLFESTAKFPVGDQRKVFLKEADKVASYDTIIKPFDYILNPSKDLSDDF